jgi:hypothetical protein
MCEVLYDEVPEGFAEIAFAAADRFGDRLEIAATDRMGMRLRGDYENDTNTLQEALELLKIALAC